MPQMLHFVQNDNGSAPMRLGSIALFADSQFILLFSCKMDIRYVSFCIFGSCKIFRIMETDSNWIIIRIDGKLAGISMSYDRLADISARIAQKSSLRYGEISAISASFDDILKLRGTVKWEDLLLFGTEFQKRVWKKLWDMASEARLLSYSDFAESCNNRAGVRAVAHAVGLNPLPVLIPCHLVVPKEAIDRIKDIQRKAEDTIFKGEDLCRSSILSDNAIDFGDYALGKDLKRRLISMDVG